MSVEWENVLNGICHKRFVNLQLVPAPKPQRGQRRFSEPIERDAVVAYETGRQSVREIAHALKVSHASVYKWIDEYSTLPARGIVIVERKGSQADRIARLEAEFAAAHRTVARQTIRLDYHRTPHDYLRTELGVDVKKTMSDTRASSASAPGSDTTDHTR